MLETGTKLPNVGAHNDEGALMQFSSFKGKPLVVWFYPRADTPG